MNLFEQLVEQRVAEAQAHGAFDELPGQGQPLQLRGEIREVEQKALLQRRRQVLPLKPCIQQPDSRLLQESDYLEKLN